MTHPKKYRVPQKDKRDNKIILAAIKVLKRETGRRCKGYALGCFNCGIWRTIEDLETWIWLTE